MVHRRRLHGASISYGHRGTLWRVVSSILRLHGTRAWKLQVSPLKVRTPLTGLYGCEQLCVQQRETLANVMLSGVLDVDKLQHLADHDEPLDGSYSASNTRHTYQQIEDEDWKVCAPWDCFRIGSEAKC